MPERVVFDAEPLIAHADGEPGSEAVSAYLEDVVSQETEGHVSAVNLAEVRYVLARKYERAVADEYVDWLFDLGLRPADVGPTWRRAADYVVEYNPALGDAFALATAAHLGATLLVGADVESAGVIDVPIERFRRGSG